MALYEMRTYTLTSAKWRKRASSITGLASPRCRRAGTTKLIGYFPG